MLPFSFIRAQAAESALFMLGKVSMKMSARLALLALVFSSAACSQLSQLPLVPPKEDILATPAAAKCDVSLCQQQCYVQYSQCDRNDDSGCGAKMQTCLQACASQCR